MKLSQIKKKYPEAFNEWYFSDVILDVDIRNFYASIVDHFDTLGMKMTVILGLSETVRFIVNHEYEMISTPFRTRSAAETAGLSKLFEIRNKQLKERKEK